jgi:xanthosine utilization system XapX-like protein
MSNLGIWIGFSFAGLCVLGIVYSALAMKTPADVSPRQLNLVILIAGGLVGWVVGMLITPISPKEQAVFSETGKALSTFVTGYLVAKIDRIFDIAMKQDENVNGLFVGRAAPRTSQCVLLASMHASAPASHLKRPSYRNERVRSAMNCEENNRAGCR